MAGWVGRLGYSWAILRLNLVEKPTYSSQRHSLVKKKRSFLDCEECVWDFHPRNCNAEVVYRVPAGRYQKL